MKGTTKPEEALNLPKGRLKIGEFVADFSPEQVLACATAIVAHFERADGFEGEHLFVSQADIIAYAANEFGTGPLKIKTF